jgi:thiosulfate/3-mercaptopyruvate sulfurtransferase
MPETQGYPHPELLETPAWLLEHYQDPDVKVLDARGARDYAQGHIPGALLLPSPVFKAEGSPETCSVDEFAATAGALGIRPTDTVIAYDAGGPQAARAWWAFTRFGHPTVRMLHGGLRAWTAAGGPLSTEPAVAVPATYTPNPAHDEIACTIPQAVGVHGREDVLFWDTRTLDEYTGADPRNNPAERVGHIPGAVHLEWTDLTDPATGLFKPAEEMRRILNEKGITPQKDVIAY